MAFLTKEEVLKFAKLARLELAEAEIEKFSGQLSAILEYVDKLQKVDTKDVKPIAQITGLINVSRDDRVDQCDAETREAILKQAPKRKDDLVETLGVFE